MKFRTWKVESIMKIELSGCPLSILFPSAIGQVLRIREAGENPLFKKTTKERRHSNEKG